MMFRWIVRAALALVAARLAAKYVRPASKHPAPKAENPSPYKAKPKERTDFGKRGKKMPTASRRKSSGATAETRH